MDDQDLIYEYERLNDDAMDLDDQLNSVNEQIEDINLQMGGVEEEWLKTHKCSCGLIGLRNGCSHEEVK